MPVLTLISGDDVALEAELEVPPGPRAGLVLCHPHPLHGGSMRSVVVGSLFAGLPARGVACLRFNFRGVEGSEGEYSDGDREQLDAQAALDHLRGAVPAGTPVAMMGWSFGADVALSVDDPGHAGWFLVAPPGRWGRQDTAAHDPRPKRIILAEHDQYRNPRDVETQVAAWTNTRVDVIGGADHFFIGRTDRLVELAAEFAAGLS